MIGLGDLEVYEALKSCGWDIYAASHRIGCPPVDVYVAIDRLNRHSKATIEQALAEHNERLLIEAEVRAQEIEADKKRRKSDRDRISKIIRQINRGRGGDLDWMLPLPGWIKRQLLEQGIGNVEKLVSGRVWLGPKARPIVREFVAHIAACCDAITKKVA